MHDLQGFLHPPECTLGCLFAAAYYYFINAKELQCPSPRTIAPSPFSSLVPR